MYYKDLEVWKESVNLVIDIYFLTKTFPTEEQYGLVSQMRRCAVSIPSNIAEGSVRQSDKDTLRFIDIAIGSLAELDTQIIISNKLNYINDTEEVSAKISKLFALIRGYKKYLTNNAKTN